jgi:hypothetical protein
MGIRLALDIFVGIIIEIAFFMVCFHISLFFSRNIVRCQRFYSFQ